MSKAANNDQHGTLTSDRRAAQERADEMARLGFSEADCREELHRTERCLAKGSI
jgi:hypothetical protein